MPRPAEIARRGRRAGRSRQLTNPAPQEAAALVDQIDALLTGLPELHAQILERRLQGFSVAEIAEQTEVSRQTVYRVLDLLGERLLKQAAK